MAGRLHFVPRLPGVVFGLPGERPSVDAASADGNLLRIHAEGRRSRMSLGYYEDWSKTVLGRRRRVRARDRKAPRRYMDPTDKKLGASKAWILGGAAGDSADQPCIVFLTNRALYVDISPY